MIDDTRRSVVVVLDHPVQHFSPAFRELEASELLATLVLYRSTGEGGAHDVGFGHKVEWDIDLLSGYRWWAPPRPGISSAAIATFRQLERAAPEVVLCFGWATPTVRLAILWALIRKRKLLLYGDSTWQHDRRGLTGMVRSGLLRLLFRLSAGALSTGSFNREFYIRHGMHPAAIAAGVCPVDTAFYGSARRRDRVPMEDGPLAVGFAGKLIPRKGVDELLAAIALLPSGSVTARIVGEGSERPALEALADELGIGECVTFLGFRNQTEMPSFLASCDVIVVPSRVDMLVLVVLEAVAAGAAVIVSSGTAVWGPGDLIEHEVTGLVYQSGEPSELAAGLLTLATDRNKVLSLASAAADRLDDYGPAAFRRHLEKAIGSLG